MCGIAGFTRFHQPTGDLDTLKAMGHAMYHRGPDAGGEYLAEHIGLCHRRLAIIDLSDAGIQPMHYDDGALSIVFNGEIYNFQSLRDELVNQGYRFRSQTDTEVLLALYQRDGHSMLQKINGMFAFAIWDQKKQQLLLARDRLGKKPLYYCQLDGDLVFGSELKTLLTLARIPREIRPDAVADFFAYQYIPDPKTIFKGIHKLEPGHCLIVNVGGIEKQQYWDLDFSHTAPADEAQLAQGLLKIIDQSTRQRMISDVPLGAFLSGGVDSSAIVALMAKANPAPVTTCSIGFDSEQFDEVQYARQIAEQYHTDHHEFTVRQNVADNLVKIARFFDEPFADPSLVPTYFVSELARQRVTVALAGDGGDENFAGYSKYATDALENRLRNLIPAPLRKLAALCAKPLANAHHPVLKKAHTLLHTLAVTPAYGFYLTNSFFRENLWPRLTNARFRQQLAGYHPSQVTLQHYKNANGPDHLSKILYTDFKTYLPGDILVKVDRMSMAHSLEVRAPMLDYQVVEYAARIPSTLKLHGTEKKHILKRAFAGYLDHDILYRKKMGFSVPLAAWLRNEIKGLTQQTLFSCSQGLPDYFDMDAVKQLWDDHQSGETDNSQELWSMLMFQLWHNHYACNKDTAA